MARYPWQRRFHFLDLEQQVSLGVVTFEESVRAAVVTTASGQLKVALDGEFSEAGVERQRPRATGVAVGQDCDAALLLAGWQHEGPAFLARLNGEFAALIWDSQRGELHVVTDRFGLRPVYVAQPPGAFGAASEMSSLLALPGVDASWSEAGLSQFFAFGHFLNDDTFLRGVRAVPPATFGTYRLADGEYCEQAYWRLRPGSLTGSPEEIVVELQDRFVAAVVRRAPPGTRLGLSLSGGLDARTILGAMPAGVDLQTVSLGIEGSLDHRSAAEMARLAGVPHHQFVLDNSFLADFERHLREMVALTDGHYLDQGIVMATLPRYREHGIEFLLRGHGGELLHMTKAYAFSLDAAALRASETELEDWLLTHLTGYMLAGVPDDLFTLDVRAGAAASLRRALARCEPAERPVDRVWALFLNERIHRETALSMHVFRQFVGIRQPYLDNDVIEALFSLPAAMKLGDRLQAGLLGRCRPDFLGVTNANTGARVGARPLESALARLRLKVGARLGWRGYQPYERLGLWLRRELRSFVETELNSEHVLGCGLFKPEALRRVVSQHVSDEANQTFLLMSLVIFGIGLRGRWGGLPVLACLP